MAEKMNIHLIRTNTNRWIIKEEGASSILMEKDSKEEALPLAAKIAKERHVELIVHDDVVTDEGMESIDLSFPDEEHVET